MTPRPFTPPLPGDRTERLALARAFGRLAVAAATGADTHGPARAAARAAAACAHPTGEAVVRYAEAEGLAALIAPSLAPLAGAGITVGLADTTQRVAARAAVLGADRVRLAAALRSAGVQWRPLKGAWLAEQVYPEPAMRPMADTDIWVPPAYAASAHAAVTALGYRHRGTSWKHAVYGMPEDRVVDRRGEHPDNPRPIDVHAHLLEGFRGIVIDIGALAAPPAVPQSPSAAAATPTADWPDAAAMLLHVTAHATADALGRRLRLLSLVDIAVLAGCAAEATWRRITALAAAPHVARFVWPSLTLAVREMDAPVPAAVLDALAPYVRAPLRRWVNGMDCDLVTRSGAGSATRSLLEIPRIWPLDLGERRTVLRWIAWPPRAALADRYPALATSPRWPLAYGLHAGDTWRTARRRWRQRPTR